MPGHSTAAPGPALACIHAPRRLAQRRCGCCGAAFLAAATLHREHTFATACSKAACDCAPAAAHGQGGTLGLAQDGAAAIPAAIPRRLGRLKAAALRGSAL